MSRLPARPAGADDFLKWRRSIDEHLELGQLTWDEYAMFSWLCTKAEPHLGMARSGASPGPAPPESRGAAP
jgi:hypothetical protein